MKKKGLGAIAVLHSKQRTSEQKKGDDDDHKVDGWLGEIEKGVIKLPWILQLPT